MFAGCPSQQNVAALKSWSESFGAELVEVSFDTLGLRILKPIENFEEALKVAQEQFVYCHENVFKDDGSVKGLAQKIQHAKIWKFWWDF